MGEGAGQKRAGGPVVVLGHEGGTRAEGSEVERVDKMWWTPVPESVRATNGALVPSTPFNSLTTVWFGRGGGGEAWGGG